MTLFTLIRWHVTQSFSVDPWNDLYPILEDLFQDITILQISVLLSLQTLSYYCPYLMILVEDWWIKMQCAIYVTIYYLIYYVRKTMPKPPRYYRKDI